MIKYEIERPMAQNGELSPIYFTSRVWDRWSDLHPWYHFNQLFDDISVMSGVKVRADMKLFCVQISDFDLATFPHFRRARGGGYKCSHSARFVTIAHACNVVELTYKPANRPSKTVLNSSRC